MHGILFKQSNSHYHLCRLQTSKQKYYDHNTNTLPLTVGVTVFRSCLLHPVMCTGGGGGCLIHVHNGTAMNDETLLLVSNYKSFFIPLCFHVAQDYTPFFSLPLETHKIFLRYMNRLLKVTNRAKQEIFFGICLIPKRWYGRKREQSRLQVCEKSKEKTEVYNGQFIPMMARTTVL